MSASTFGQKMVPIKENSTLRDYLCLVDGRILIVCVTTVMNDSFHNCFPSHVTNVYTSESVLVNRDKQDSAATKIFSGLASFCRCRFVGARCNEQSDGYYRVKRVC